MHGILSGAILGVAFIALAGVLRSWSNWKRTEPSRRPARLLVLVSLSLQSLLGLTALVFGLWFLLAGAP